MHGVQTAPAPRTPGQGPCAAPSSAQGPPGGPGELVMRLTDSPARLQSGCRLCPPGHHLAPWAGHVPSKGLRAKKRRAKGLRPRAKGLNADSQRAKGIRGCLPALWPGGTTVCCGAAGCTLHREITGSVNTTRDTSLRGQPDQPHVARFSAYFDVLYETHKFLYVRPYGCVSGSDHLPWILK